MRQRNHNPRVGGSSPSSGIEKVPANRNDCAAGPEPQAPVGATVGAPGRPTLSRRRLNGERRHGKFRRLVTRDGWTCWLCGEPIDPDAPEGSERAASIDHIVPLSLGGNQRLRNLRLAHRSCNSLRGNSSRGRRDAGSLRALLLALVAVLALAAPAWDVGKRILLTATAACVALCLLTGVASGNARGGSISCAQLRAFEQAARAEAKHLHISPPSPIRCRGRCGEQCMRRLSDEQAAQAQKARREIPALSIQLQGDRDVTRCTAGIPDSWEVAIWVYANGRELHASTSAGTSLYYAGDGTMVQLVSHLHGGPICARAITWEQSVSVLIAFRVV